jgi:EthD domain
VQVSERTATPSFADREARATITWVVPTRRRLSISSELFESYWQNCHGPTVAMLPGLEFYYQHRLQPDHGDFWPILPGIANDIEEAHQFDGIAQLAWVSQADYDAFAAGIDEARVPEDEENIFRVVAIQTSLEGNHRTLSDRMPDLAPAGPESHLRLFAAMRIADGVSRADFASHLLDEVAPAFARHELPLRVRAIVCEDVHPHEAPESVVVDLPLSQQYQAYVELVFDDRIAMRRFYASNGFRDAVADLADHVAQVNAFAVKESVICVADGCPTLAGRLGAARAQAAIDIGALNMIEQVMAPTPIHG